MPNLAARFRAAAPAEHGPALAGLADLEATLAELVARGRAAWPDVPIAAERVVELAATRLELGRPLAAALAALDPAELHLGAALAERAPAALAAFERHYVPRIRAALGRFQLGAGEVDEVTQIVRDRLFVADGPPRVAAYAGKGELGAIVHVIAVRAAISLLRQRQRSVALDGDALLRLRASGDLELDTIARGQREAFKDAFAAAVAELEPRDRNLLRLHLLDGVELEALARLHGVHRATVVRWLGHARRQVFERTRKRLEAELGLERDEAERLFGLIESRLDVSVERLLAAE